MTSLLELNSLVCGKPVGTEKATVTNPYDGSQVGTVTLAGRADTERAIVTALKKRVELSRYERSQILEKTRELLTGRRDEFARLMSEESGLSLRDTRYEVGRVLDVLTSSAMEALRDDGQIFSGDISAQGKSRKIFTVREPAKLVAAITPFNHPLNQVAHKVGPAIAAGAPIILKPSEKTPLTALTFAELFYQAGLPPEWLSVLVGPTEEVAALLVSDPRVEVLAFVGSVSVGKEIANKAGYKRVILELGGNDPMIVLADADLDLAAHLAAEGSFRNSGQRCTAVKRIMVEKSVLSDFTNRLVDKTKNYRSGDPLDPETWVGTVIDEKSARHLEKLIEEAVAGGAVKRIGVERRGALLAPTVLTGVSREARMVVCEAFGPLAPVMEVENLADAIQLANSTPYGLSAGVVTRSLESAMTAIKGLQCGMVNINEVPGYRIESSPFGGIKDSGLGIKEGVIEAIKYMTTVKTFSLPW